MKDEEWYVILNMNCKYEICRMCPKSGLFKGSYEECEKWIEQKMKEEMTDEEMAERFADNYATSDLDCSFRAYMFEASKDGFLAGLKAQQKWHILAEEPDVLPEEGQKVKVLTEDGYIEKSTYFYDTYYEEFAFSNIGLLKVFAWCELPTFDKE